jgi:hypothetical protein
MEGKPVTMRVRFIRGVVRLDVHLGGLISLLRCKRRGHRPIGGLGEYSDEVQCRRCGTHLGWN